MAERRRQACSGVGVDRRGRRIRATGRLAGTATGNADVPARRGGTAAHGLRVAYVLRSVIHSLSAVQRVHARIETGHPCDATLVGAEGLDPPSSSL